MVGNRYMEQCGSRIGQPIEQQTNVIGALLTRHDDYYTRNEVTRPELSATYKVEVGQQLPFDRGQALGSRAPLGRARPGRRTTR